MKFPRRIYTIEEFMRARKAIEDGHKHRLKVIGKPTFRNKVKEILFLIKKASYYKFLRTYIRRIFEIEGICQLREADATIWMNNYVISNPIEGARLIIQKAYQMKAYIDGKRHYLGGEPPAIKASIVFLEKLVEKLNNREMKMRCITAIKKWTEETVL